MLPRKAVIAVALASLMAMTVIAPPVVALSKYEIDTTYYDACLDPIYERVIGCFGEIWEWGTYPPSGAVYKNIVQIECEGSGYISRWYEWNGSSWVLLPAIPPGC